MLNLNRSEINQNLGTYKLLIDILGSEYENPNKTYDDDNAIELEFDFSEVA